MPAKRIYQVKLPTKAEGQRGYVSVCRLNVGGGRYLFLVSNFKSEEPYQRPHGSGALSEAPCLPLVRPPVPSLSPFSSPERGWGFRE